VIGTAAVTIAAPGCVTRGVHQAVVAERDQLAAKSQQLETDLSNLRRSTESLDSERVKLIDRNEELRQARQKLETQVARLEKTEQDLSMKLATTTSRLEKQEAEVDRLRGTYQGLVSDLESEVAAGQIEIERLREGIRLNVSDEILFAPGSSDLGAEGRTILGKVAGQLANNDQRIEVQGHSDNTPIRGALLARYPSNWELAAARAAAVVRLFQSKGVAPERLSAVSYGEYRPVAPNSDPRSRALNRRIEIRLLPPEEDRAAEGASAPAPGAGGR